MHSPAATIGVLTSGGLDSAILVGRLLREGQRVQPFYIRSQLVWEQAEHAAAERFLAAIAAPHLEKLVTLSLPLEDLYQGHWSLTGRGVPGADTPDEAVYLPGRNALLIVKAALWCQMHGIPRLALAPLGNNPFADAGDEFFAHLEAALNRMGQRPLEIVRPFAALSKREVMQLADSLPLELTFSCIGPQRIGPQRIVDRGRVDRSSADVNGDGLNGDGLGDLHCGECNKCAERRAAFRAAELPDPTRYLHHPQLDPSGRCEMP
jgi:7-cyano-7-deazaguanine synthase